MMLPGKGEINNQSFCCSARFELIHNLDGTIELHQVEENKEESKQVAIEIKEA